MKAGFIRADARPGGKSLPLRAALPVTLIALAAVGWWWAARMADDMTGGGMDAMGMHAMGMSETMSLAPFLLAWLAMMAAMMLPGVLPVVRLYARAAARGRAAPLPFFVAAYLAVWTLLGLPAYFAWRALDEPLADGRSWTGILAGAVLLAAAAWQVTPLKSLCLRHCRSPMGFFMRFGGTVSRPSGAVRMGASHALFCVGCCWTLFVVLVAVGTMNLAWMAVLTALIFIEKTAAYGEVVARVAAVAFAVLGAALLAEPSMLTTIT
jgi:predicted metal-binding membrane protein